jgi:hypothetical protein
MRKKLSAFINIMVRYAFDNDWGAAKRILENVAHPDVNKLQLVSPWLFENYQKMFRFDKKFEMSGYRRVIEAVGKFLCDLYKEDLFKLKFYSVETSS